MRTARAARTIGLLAVIIGCGGLAFNDESDVTTVEGRPSPGTGDVAGRDQNSPACSVESGLLRCNGTRMESCQGTPPSWMLIEECDFCTEGPGTQAICSAGPTCAAGQLACLRNELYRCNDARNRWNFVETCESAAACDANTGACVADPGPAMPACEPGALRCDGPNLQVCQEGPPEWLTLQVCASAALCVADARRVSGCTAPACEPDEWICNGTELRRCNAARTAFESVEDCGSAELCAAARARCTPAQVGDAGL